MAHAVYDKKKRCPVCLREFWASRRDAICCSPRCKKRLQRTPDVRERLRRAFDEATSSTRLITMYMDDREHKAQAHNMLKSIIRSLLEHMPDYERLALANELRESVGSDEYLKWSYSGHDDVPIVK